MSVFLQSIFFPCFTLVWLWIQKGECCTYHQNYSAWGKMGTDFCQDEVGVIRSQSRIDFLPEILFSGTFNWIYCVYHQLILVNFLMEGIPMIIHAPPLPATFLMVSFCFEKLLYRCSVQIPILHSLDCLSLRFSIFFTTVLFMIFSYSCVDLFHSC